VQFGPLGPETIKSVVDKFVFELEQQLLDKKVLLTVDADARAWIAEKGYDVRMGARPMARVIQNHIKKPLANEILFGSLVGGGAVRVTVEGEGLDFDIESAKALA
jgi:ATP-dependent Clp protease ATP-binding subunit ClpA